MNDYLDHIEESINSVLLSEMRMKASKFSDKYGEIMGPLVDNLVAIAMYPNSHAIQHWKQRAGSLVKRFVDLDIDPITQNCEENRLRILQRGVVEALNADYSAVKNHFKSVSEYYSNSNNQNGVMTPYAQYDICYEEQKDRIFNAIDAITKSVAKQDYESILTFMNNF